MFGAEDKAWTLVTIDSRPDVMLGGLFFVDEHVGWVIRDNKDLLMTADGGRHWSMLETNLKTSRVTLSRVWFLSKDRGWAAGSLDRRPAVWETADGGVSWALRHQWERGPVDSLGALLDIQFVDKLNGWAAGSDGFNAMIVATTDGGRTWTDQYRGSEIDSTARRIQFTDSLNGWVIFNGGIMRTNDGGTYWRLQYFNRAFTQDMFVTGPSEVWIAGDWNSLLHTKDGVTWSKVPVPSRPSGSMFSSVRFINDNVGWACGAFGEIIVTRNGGKKWAKEDIPGHIPVKYVSAQEIASTKSNMFILLYPGKMLVHSIRQ